MCTHAGCALECGRAIFEVKTPSFFFGARLVPRARVCVRVLRMRVWPRFCEAHRGIDVAVWWDWCSVPQPTAEHFPGVATAVKVAALSP